MFNCGMKYRDGRLVGGGEALVGCSLAWVRDVGVPNDAKISACNQSGR